MLNIISVLKMIREATKFTGECSKRWQRGTNVVLNGDDLKVSKGYIYSFKDNNTINKYLFCFAKYYIIGIFSILYILIISSFVGVKIAIAIRHFPYCTYNKPS